MRFKSLLLPYGHPSRVPSRRSPQPRRGSTSFITGWRRRLCRAVTRGSSTLLFPLWGLGGFLLLLCTCGPAPLIAQQQARIYTGNEPPVCFDTSRYRNRQVESYSILQFLGARCTEITKLDATPGLFRYFDAHQHYPEYQRLPLDIYFQPDGAPLEEIYHINTGSAAHHLTLPMRYEGTYYVVIRDQTKPSVLIVNSVTLQAEFRRCCALTESIIPDYLHRR